MLMALEDLKGHSVRGIFVNKLGHGTVVGIVVWSDAYNAWSIKNEGERASYYHFFEGVDMVEAEYSDKAKSYRIMIA